MNKTIFRTHVTGLTHHDYVLMLSKLQVGTALTLVRDAANPRDHRAIQIHCGSHQIGWVPKQDGNNTAQAVIAALMDTGMQLTCTVAAHDPLVDHVQKRLYVDITLPNAIIGGHRVIFRGGTATIDGNHYVPQPLYEEMCRTKYMEGVAAGKLEAVEACTGCNEEQLLAARAEGVEAGKALHLMNSFGSTTQFDGVILPKSLVEAIKATGAQEKEASISNTAYNKGYAKATEKYAEVAKQETANVIEMILNGTISLFDAAAHHLNISRREAKKRWHRVAVERLNAPYEDMVVRVVRPEYYKTMSTVQLELRSATEGSAMNPAIPHLKVFPGDTIRVTVVKRNS